MPKYVIERDIPNVGSVTPDQVIAISQKSCSVLHNLGPKIQWLHIYVTEDKIYCVYIAPNEEMVREHARQGGFPANHAPTRRALNHPVTHWRPCRTRPNPVIERPIALYQERTLRAAWQRGHRAQYGSSVDHHCCSKAAV